MAAMAEPTETDRAIAEGARVAGDENAQSVHAEWKAIERELAAAAGEPVEEPNGELDQTKTTPRDDKGRFQKGEAGEQKPDGKDEKKGKEGAVSRAERAALEREAKRQAKAAISNREAQLTQREQQLALREQAIEAVAKGRERFEAGDYDGAAQAFGFKTWNELNDAAARSFASPEYKRVRDLENRSRQLEEERARERQAQQTAAQQAREQKILTDFHASLAESLPKAEDPIIAGLAAEDPHFVGAVFNRVVAAARQGEDLDPIDVAEEIVEQARAHYLRVSKVFGGRPTSQAEAPRGASPDRAGSKKQPERPKTHVSRASAAEASAPPDFETEEDFIAFGAAAMRRAHNEDEAAGRSNQW